MKRKIDKYQGACLSHELAGTFYVGYSRTYTDNFVYNYIGNVKGLGKIHTIYGIAH